MQIVSLTLPNCRINACSPPSRTQACFLPSVPPSLQSFNRVISLRNEDFVKQANVKQGGEVPSSCIIHAQRQKQQLKFLKIWVPPALAALVAFSPLFIPPVSFGEITNAQRGATLFRRACIGCHDTGGNIIQPGATLFLKDLQRNGVETEEEIYRLTYFGKGRMPGFGENCTPRGQCTFGARLKEDEIKLLAEFVKSQADLGWPNIENYGD